MVLSNGMQNFIDIDFHAKNYLVAFESKVLTISDLLAEDMSSTIFGDPENAFNEWTPYGSEEKILIYKSQPIYRVKHGDEIALEDIYIKVADFGKGRSFWSVLKLIGSQLIRRR